MKVPIRGRCRSAPGCAAPISWGRWGRATIFSRCSAWRGSLIPGPPRCSGCGEEQVTVLIHSGSRGFGHQVCSDYVRTMDAVQARYDISAAGSSAGVRAAELTGGSAVPGGDGMCGELCLGQPGGAGASRARIGRGDPGAERGGGNAPGLRRGAQRRQARDPRRADSVRPSQGSHTRVSSWLTRDSERVPRGWPAGVHSRLDGHQQLRARRPEGRRWSARSGPPVTGREGG